MFLMLFPFAFHRRPTGTFADAQLPSKRIIGPKNQEFLATKREEFEEYLQVRGEAPSVSDRDGALAGVCVLTEAPAAPRAQEQSTAGRLPVSSQWGVPVPGKNVARRQPG